MYTMSSACTIRVKQSDFEILYDLTSDFVVWSYTIRSLWCFLFQNEFWKSSPPSPRVYGIFDLKLNFGKVVPLPPLFGTRGCERRRWWRVDGHPHLYVCFLPPPPTLSAPSPPLVPVLCFRISV